MINRTKILFYFTACLVIFLLVFASMNAQQMEESREARMQDPDSFNLRVDIPSNLEQWQARRAWLRQKTLVNAGLWPEPKKNPLNPRIFNRKEGEGFAVSKVYFESLPGYLVTGSLYEPTGRKGPFPAILTPHGHWEYGRLQNSGAGSIPGRCIDMARQGFVVFSPDMIGYNDSIQFPHDPNKTLRQMKADKPLPWEPRTYRPDFKFPEAEYNGLSLGGLQLWNNIRGVDFLVSLDNVDAERIGATGASGGASQTILLIGVDDRISAAAPVNIIGAEKHPGCRCENIPNLWIDASTLELTATFAPKPLLMVSATEDPWTPKTPEREFPLMQKFYALYKAKDKVANAHINGPHNYNADSRAAVYEWMVRHLKAEGPLITDPAEYAELAALGDLRVFPDKILPECASSAQDILKGWIDNSKQQIQESLPADREEYKSFKKDFRTALAQNLNVKAPDIESLNYSVKTEESRSDIRYMVEMIGSKKQNNWVELESACGNDDPEKVVLAVFPEKLGTLLHPDGSSDFPWLKPLLDRKYHVYHIRGYASDQISVSMQKWDSFSWSDAYNRSNLTNGILDAVTAIRSIREVYPDLPLTVIGLGDKGLTAAAAAALDGRTNRVAVDLDAADPSYWKELRKVFPVHGFNRIGDLQTIFLLLAESDLIIFNSADGYDPAAIREYFSKTGFSENLTFLPNETEFNPNHLR